MAAGVLATIMSRCLSISLAWARRRIVSILQRKTHDKSGSECRMLNAGLSSPSTPGFRFSVFGFRSSVFWLPSSDRLVTCGPRDDIRRGSQLQRQPAAGLLDLGPGWPGDRVVRHGGCHDQAVALEKVSLDGLEHLAGRGHWDDPCARRGPEEGRGRDQGDLMASGQGRSGQAQAHPAAAGVGDETHGIDVLSRATGCDEETHND